MSLRPITDAAVLLEHAVGVRALALALCRDPNRADEVVQETWRVALEAGAPEAEEVGAWLAGIARRVAHGLRRSEARRRERESRSARVESLPSTAELAERAALHRELVEAVLKLDEPYRSTILLRYFEGIPPREIAQRQHASRDAVKSRLARGLAQLRKRLALDDEDRMGAWIASLGAQPLPLAVRLRPTHAAVGAFAVVVALALALCWASLRAPSAMPVANSLAMSGDATSTLTNSLQSEMGFENGPVGVRHVSTHSQTGADASIPSSPIHLPGAPSMQRTSLRLALPWFVSLAWVQAAGAQYTVRASVDSHNAQGDGASSIPQVGSMSADGRYVVFQSDATTLVPNDTNSWTDVFRRDLQSRQTVRVSVDSSGAQVDKGGAWVCISANGRFAAFQSIDTNLVTPSTNGTRHIYLRDIEQGSTTLVSASTAGAPGNGESRKAAISGDGRYVAFGSYASNLVAGDTNGVADVFVRDCAAHVTTRVSVSTAGSQGITYDSLWPSISSNGMIVAFESLAANLVVNDTNNKWDVFVHDSQTGVTERVSVTSGGVQGDNSSLRASISGDGQRVAFASDAMNFAVPDINNAADVFVRNRQTGTTIRVSENSNGVQGDGDHSWPSLSVDGRYVAYHSDSGNLDLALPDTNAQSDVFVRDMQSSTTTRVSLSVSGAQTTGPMFNSANPAISGDGRFIAFVSDAANLVANDTNGAYDIFVRDTAPLAPMVFCTAGTTSNGCVPAIGSIGNASASAVAGFDITVHSLEGQVQGIAFYGVDNSNYSPQPWGAGTSYLCVKSPTQRMAVQSSGGTWGACDGTLSADWNAFRAAHPNALGAPFSAGCHVFVQGWFRDPPSPKTTSLSDALEFVVGP